jgi:integrase
VGLILGGNPRADAGPSNQPADWFESVQDDHPKCLHDVRSQESKVKMRLTYRPSRPVAAAIARMLVSSPRINRSSQSRPRTIVTKPRKPKSGEPKPPQSCKDHAVCTEFGLHRFRKTFATHHHKKGVPVRTIQCWLEHSSLETTLLYLADSDDESEKMQKQVNSTWDEFD